MLKRKSIFCMTMALVFAFSGAAYAQVGFTPDFTVTVADSADPVDADSTVNFEVGVANDGGNGDPTVSIILDIYLPMDVPVPMADYIAADEDTQTAIIDAFSDSANILVDDNIWNDDVSGIYIGTSFNNACESLIIQPQELVLPGGTSGSFYYDATLPSSGGVSGLALENSGGERTVLNYGVGGCNSDLFETCAGIPCMGPRLTMHPAMGATVEIVDDGTDPANDGCTDFSSTFTAGNVALIDRGACNFSVKAENATNAGASGVIIANTAALGSVTPTEDSIMTMGCTDAQCHSLIITIPAAFVSYNDGEAIKAAIDGGGATLYMGVRDEDPEYKQTKGYIWESSAEPNDVDPDNDRFTETTTLGGGGETPCTPVYVAAAASYPNNTPPWSSDLGISNNSDADLMYKFRFLPAGADNTAVAYSDDFMLAANSNMNYVDIWNQFAGEGQGSIEVCVSDVDAAGVTSRIYTTTDAGTLGQSFVGLPGATPAKMIGTGETVRLGFLTQTGTANDGVGFRTNVGFMNAGAQVITVDADFYAADGTLLGSNSVNLNPYSSAQWNRAFNMLAGVNNDVELGYVDVSSDTADASYIAYASVVDNMSNDPTTIMPFDNAQMVGGGAFDCTPIWVAAAAAFPNNTPPWASDLGLTNLGGNDLMYKFQMLPRNADNTGATFSDTFTLGGNQAIAYTDIWNSIAGGQGAGAINVCVDDADMAGVVSRIYTTTDEGTFGQSFVGMRGAAPAKVATGEKVRLGYLFENDDYRTNIGFMNAGANTITVMVEFFDMDGTSLGMKSVNVAPYSNTQWNNAFTLDPINASGIDAGFADVWTETADANFLTYASIVDNGTGDPTTIWPF